jgi:hypothetical protein
MPAIWECILNKEIGNGDMMSDNDSDNKMRWNEKKKKWEWLDYRNPNFEPEPRVEPPPKPDKPRIDKLA